MPSLRLATCWLSSAAVCRPWRDCQTPPTCFCLPEKNLWVYIYVCSTSAFLKALLCHQVHKFSGLERLGEVKAEAGCGGTNLEDHLLEISYFRPGTVWATVRRAAAYRDSRRIQGSSWRQWAAGNATKRRGCYFAGCVSTSLHVFSSTFLVPSTFSHLKKLFTFWEIA